MFFISTRVNFVGSDNKREYDYVKIRRKSLFRVHNIVGTHVINFITYYDDLARVTQDPFLGMITFCRRVKPNIL